MKVRTTYLFPNNMIITFDSAGKQIPDLQGRYTDALHSEIKKHSDDKTEWIGFSSSENAPSHHHIEVSSEKVLAVLRRIKAKVEDNSNRTALILIDTLVELFEKNPDYVPPKTEWLYSRSEVLEIVARFALSCNTEALDAQQNFNDLDDWKSPDHIKDTIEEIKDFVQLPPYSEKP